MGYHSAERDDFVRIVELTPDLRRRIEATIEHLIALLDDYDPDPDLEPSLGDCNHFGASGVDLEDDSELNEPWLTEIGHAN